MDDCNIPFSVITDKIIERNKIGHAYLIKTDNSYNRIVIFEFIKKIVNTYQILQEEKDIILNLIDNNEYGDLIVIEPNGVTIKKEQIISLENQFKTKEIMGQKRFYIIEYAENLNDSALNSMLKFLEEPTTDIVAFLITKNPDLVKNTIVSRCQTLLLIDNEYDNTTFEIKELSKNLIEKILKYKKKASPYLADFYKNDARITMEILNSAIVELNNIIKTTTDIEQIEIIKLVNSIENCIQLLKKNVNIRMVFDKLIYDVYGVDKNV